MVIHCDGGYNPRTGMGTFGWIAYAGRKIYRQYRLPSPVKAKEINQMEFIAVLDAITWVKDEHNSIQDCDVTIHTDSQFVVDVIAKRRIDSEYIKEARQVWKLMRLLKKKMGIRVSVTWCSRYKERQLEVDAYHKYHDYVSTGGQEREKIWTSP